MKKTIVILGITLTAATASAAELVEAIVVRVGDRIVTRTQYEKRLADTLRDGVGEASPAELEARRKEIRSRFLDEIIGELLLKDRADRLGITVSEPEVKDAVERLKSQYGITTDEQFAQSLASSGLTRPEMEARLRDTLLTQKVFARELRNRSDLTDAELRERYNREKEQYRLPERAHLREIVIVRPENPLKIDEARQRATEVAAAARVPGTDFSKLASTMSESGTRDKGGDLGEVNRGDLVAELDKEVFAATAGSVLGPLETKAAWHILKVEQRLPSEVPGFDSLKERLRRDAGEETFQRDYRAYVEKLRRDAFIQINEENVPKS